MTFVKKYQWTIIGLAIGSIFGALYYHFVGCSSGSCSISSNPFNMTAYGALMGGLLFSNFKSKSVSTTSKTQENE
ncbi:MAG: hypothetical protein IPI60_16300 [Saprospiraceae bacterium]|jgi:phage shock protein E|nr:hypothetical protein [Saprospiraceae bacterium]